MINPGSITVNTAHFKNFKFGRSVDHQPTFHAVNITIGIMLSCLVYIVSNSFPAQSHSFCFCTKRYFDPISIKL